MPSFIKVSNLSYIFPDGRKLFENLNFNISSEKIGLTGDNGSGKTTLLKLISGELLPASGSVNIQGTVTKFNQEHSHLYNKDVAEMLGVKEQLDALHHITSGGGSEDDFATLGDNWDIEEKVCDIMLKFGLSAIPVDRKLSCLSGGEVQRLMLASCFIKNSDFILFDEPTNNLDIESREAFYDVIKKHKKGMLIISHDRSLLRCVDKIIELNAKGLKIYGGNYDFYIEKKQLEENALLQKIANTEVELKKQNRLSAAVLSLQDKKSRQAENKKENSGIPKIFLNKRKNDAERTTSKLKIKLEKKTSEINSRLEELKDRSLSSRVIKLDLESMKQPNKCIIKASNLNYGYNEVNLWETGLNFEICSGERVLISGNNGTGKTTLVNLILQKVQPYEGSMKVSFKQAGFIDQKYEILNPAITVLENIKHYAPPGMPEHELRIMLARFLFFNDDAHKITDILSGGEKCRLAMACLLAVSNTPEIIIIDELTNNLDLKSVEQVQDTLNTYPGALIVISHDIDFVHNLGITKTLDLNKYCVSATFSPPKNI